MASYSHFIFYQLVIKPDSLLLEDQRSEASGERDNQTNILFMELVLICDVFTMKISVYVYGNWG